MGGRWGYGWRCRFFVTFKTKEDCVKSEEPGKEEGDERGMQIPDHWPWEEAKKLFVKPDVVKGDDLDVSEAAVW